MASDGTLRMLALTLPAQPEGFKDLSHRGARERNSSARDRGNDAIALLGSRRAGPPRHVPAGDPEHLWRPSRSSALTQGRRGRDGDRARERAPGAALLEARDVGHPVRRRSPGMSPDAQRKDLILLVADKNMDASLKGLLSRSKALGHRQVTFDLYVHPDRDPGCLLRGHDFLRPFVSLYERALVLLDHEGCGRGRRGSLSGWRAISRGGSTKRAGDSGAHGRCRDRPGAPQVRVVGGDSPSVDRALGWEGRPVSLRSWLPGQELLATGAVKPARPKEAVERRRCAPPASRVPPRSTSARAGPVRRHRGLHRFRVILKLKRLPPRVVPAATGRLVRKLSPARQGSILVSQGVCPGSAEHLESDTSKKWGDTHEGPRVDTLG